jgi:hypothetical protein
MYKNTRKINNLSTFESKNVNQGYYLSARLKSVFVYLISAAPFSHNVVLTNG